MPIYPLQINRLTTKRLTVNNIKIEINNVLYSFIYIIQYIIFYIYIYILHLHFTYTINLIHC